MYLQLADDVTCGTAICFVSVLEDVWVHLLGLRNTAHAVRRLNTQTTV